MKTTRVNGETWRFVGRTSVQLRRYLVAADPPNTTSHEQR